MRAAATHKSEVERSLVSARARISAALDALEDDEIQEARNKARVELEAADKAVRHAELKLGAARLGTTTLLDSCSEETKDVDTQNWLLKNFTEEDSEMADGHHELRVNFPSRVVRTGRRTSTGASGTQLDEQVKKALETEDISKVLQRAGSFDFDALAFCEQLETLAINRPISVLGAHLADETNILREIRDQSLVSDYKEFQKAYLCFLSRLDEMYKPEAVYHGVAHACDVMATTEWFLRSRYLSDRFNALDHFMALVASAIHDVGHPGKNNLFHTKTLAPVAVRYNDKSVLENMHVALAFEMMQDEAECNWFSMLNVDDTGSLGNLQQFVRKGLIGMVLATDMAKHGRYVQSLQELAQSSAEEPVSPATSSLRRPSREPAAPEDKQKALEKKLFLLETTLHASDISNPTKIQPIMLKWTKRVLDEFWAQGDEERQLGLEISPLCDRSSGQDAVPKGQIGFISFVVQPYYLPLAELIPEVKEAAEQLERNKEWWRGKDAELVTYDHLFGSASAAASA